MSPCTRPASVNCLLITVTRFAMPSSTAKSNRNFAFFSFDSISVAERSGLAIRHGTDGNPPPGPMSMNFAFFGRNSTNASDSSVCRSANSSAVTGPVRCSSVFASVTSSKCRVRPSSTLAETLIPSSPARRLKMSRNALFTP